MCQGSYAYALLGWEYPDNLNAAVAGCIQAERASHCVHGYESPLIPTICFGVKAKFQGLGRKQ